MNTNQINNSFEHCWNQEDQAYQLQSSLFNSSLNKDLFLDEGNNMPFDQATLQNEFYGQNNVAIDQTALSNGQNVSDNNNQQKKQKKEQRKVEEAQQIIQDFQDRVDTKLEENKTEDKILLMIKDEVCEEMGEARSTIYGYQRSLLKQGPQWFYDKNMHKKDKIGKVYLYNKKFRKSVEDSMRNFKELSVSQFYLQTLKNLKGDLEEIGHECCCLNRKNLSKEEYKKLKKIIKSIVKKKDKEFFKRINDLNDSLNQQNTIQFSQEDIDEVIINLLTKCQLLVRNLLENGFGIEQIVSNTLNSLNISYLIRNCQPQQFEALRDYVLRLHTNLTQRDILLIRKAVIYYLQNGYVLRDFNLISQIS